MTAGAARGMTTVGAVGLEPEVGGGEEQLIRGWKAHPPQVFTILKPGKEKKGGRGLQKMKWDVK